MPATFQPDRMPGYVLPKYAYRKPPELGSGDSPLYPGIVVGAGLAGLTSALELGSRAVRTVLLDDDDTVGAQGLRRLRAEHDALFTRYGVGDNATYVFRAHGHVLARCTGISCDRLFDQLRPRLDAMPNARRATALAPVISRIEEQRGDLTGIDED